MGEEFGPPLPGGHRVEDEYQRPLDIEAMAAMATAVFPAPQGRTTTPLPEATKASGAWRW